MSNSLNATIFNNSHKRYHTEFEILLIKITKCYKKMLTDHIKVPDNENEIRDRLLFDYLRNNTLRKKIKLNDYIFDPEVPEGKTAGRTDIKIQTKNSFDDTDAYYIIECKRVNSINTKGKTGLNAEYVTNGIIRFVEDYYSSYYGLNGMIGFVIDRIDIHKNIENINFVNDKFFPQSNTQRKLEKSNFISEFDYHYHSEHKTNSGSIITLYHLMLDFSKNMS